MFRIYLLTAALGALLATPASAQAPAYQRTRGGANDWHARGGHAQHWRGPVGGMGGLLDPFFVAPPIVAGSFYQRPYPYHFDYYRYRWGGADQMPQGEMMPVAECPCIAHPPAVEVVE